MDRYVCSRSLVTATREMTIEVREVRTTVVTGLSKVVGGGKGVGDQKVVGDAEVVGDRRVVGDRTAIAVHHQVTRHRFKLI